MKWILTFILFFLTNCQSENDEYHCIWYKECRITDEYGRQVLRNCLSGQPAQPINDDEAEKALKRRCPHFFDNDGNTENYYREKFILLRVF